MLYEILKCLICIFAVYGFFVLITGAAELVRCRIKGRRPKVRIVLFVQDAEEQIEYIVRYVVKKEYATKVLSNKKLAIVDVNSGDNTSALLEKLQRSFPSIEVLNFSDLIKEMGNRDE